MSVITMHPSIRTCRARQEIRGALAGKPLHLINEAEIKAQEMIDHGVSPSRAIEHALAPFRRTRIASFLCPDTYGEKGTIRQLRQQVTGHRVTDNNEPPPRAA